MNEPQPTRLGAAAPLSNSEQARKYMLLDEHEKAHAEGKHLSHKKARELHDLIAKDPTAELLIFGRIPMTPVEHDTVDKLVAKHGDQVAGMTRRDPGNTGPLLVHVGDGTYEIDTAGKQKKVA